VVAAGGWVHPALVVATPPGGVRGLFMTEPVAAGEPLAYVPPAACVTLEAVPEALAAALPGSAADKVACALALRASRGHEDAYTASLPSADEVLPCFPRAWSAEQRAALGHPRLEAALEAQRAGAEALHAALASACTAGTAGAAAEAPSLRALLWAQACVHTRSYGHGGGALSVSMEPLMDCINHAPFGWHLQADAGLPTHNVLHTYVPADCAPERAAKLGLRHLPPACAAAGCAALLALRALAPREEVLNSYAGAVAGGQLSLAGSLATFGFVPGPPGALAPDERDEAAAEARAQLLLAVSSADAALPGAGREALLQSALALFGRQAGEAAEAEAAAAAAARDEPARLAAQYRLGRGLGLARAAMALLPPEALAGEGLRRGVAAGVRDAPLRSRVWEALAGRAAAPVSPKAAYDSLRGLS